MKKSVLVLVLIVLLSFSILAQQEYSLPLLAVQESADGELQGSSAELTLELREGGSGRVFLDTFPATKVDTQISTRFAKEIACSHYKLDCDKFDFIYTIKSSSSIIGGPSAGAAIAALTTIAVRDLEYTDNVAITGTINSGAIIGPVGGVKEKVEASAAQGHATALIPLGAGQHKQGNETLNVIQYGSENLSITVKEVVSLDEVLLELTGEQLNGGVVVVQENPQYQQIMQQLQTVLCDRTEKIQTEIRAGDVAIDENITKDIDQRNEIALNASRVGDYYSSASYCFGNNIQLRRELYRSENRSLQQLQHDFVILQRKKDALLTKVSEEKIDTISDLQTLMVVKERLQDVQLQIEEFNTSNNESLQGNQNRLAYAEERFFSAISWTQFFAMNGKKFALNQDVLRTSCIQKISEAEQRHQYVSLFLNPTLVEHINDKIGVARKSLEEKEPALCLITATQAKADSNAILSSFGLNNETSELFFQTKRDAAARVIAENSAAGSFPILGYSYYKYAQSLEEREQHTGLVYLEYALEMSELSIYFPEEKALEIELDTETWLFFTGFVLGFVVAVMISFMVMRRKRE